MLHKANHLAYTQPRWYGSQISLDFQQKLFDGRMARTNTYVILNTSHTAYKCNFSFTDYFCRFVASTNFSLGTFCCFLRRSCSQMFFKIYVLQNCVISTGKNLCMVAEMLQKNIFIFNIF